MLGCSVSSIAYLFHWLCYKKRKIRETTADISITRETTTELSLTTETAIGLAPNSVPLYDEIRPIKSQKMIEMQQNSAYSSSRND